MQRKINLSFFKRFKKSWDELKSILGRDPLLFEIAAKIKEPENSDRLEDCMQFITQDGSEEIQPESFQIEYRQGISNYELKKARIRVGLEQEELSILLGKSKSYIGLLERFRMFPEQEDMDQMSKIFGYDAMKLFPEWTRVIIENRNKVRSSMIVEVGKLALNNPEVLQLESENITEQTMSKKVDQQLLKEKIYPLLDELTSREQKILIMRFGINDGVSHTLEEVAHEFGVVRERIRQIEAKALMKIQNIAIEKGIDLSKFI